jgi:hypothetical protein
MPNLDLTDEEKAALLRLVKHALEIEAEAALGFSEADMGVARDNARQLKLKPESTGFED